MMRTILLLSLIGCASPKPPAATPGMKIKLATVYVDDQDKALHVYTDVLGFAKKDDVSNGGYRWLTVSDPDGGQLLLASAGNPAGKAYQQALYQQHAPAVMFFTDDVHRDYERMKAHGATLAGPPTEVEAGSQIVLVDDGCGNWVQITQLAK